MRLRAASGKIKLPDAYTGTLRRLDLQKSASAAQGKKDGPRDDGDANDHPVLEVDPQNGKVLDKKMQRLRAPALLWRAKRFDVARAGGCSGIQSRALEPIRF